MKTCLVCEKEKVESTLKCKMCGMGVEKIHKYSGFVFCCQKCADQFGKIYENADTANRQKLEHSSIII